MYPQKYTFCFLRAIYQTCYVRSCECFCHPGGLYPYNLSTFLIIHIAVYENKYTNIDEHKLAQEDFSKCLKCVYSLNVLNEALLELNKISNCISAKGFARDILKLRKRYLHSCKLKELIQEVAKAINSYDEGPNFELIRAEDERNSKKRAAFWEKVEAVGREIF